MNITIISCLDMYEHRVEQLWRSLRADGHQVSVLLPGFWHTQKCVRSSGPKWAELLPVKPYYSRYSLARICSHIGFSRDALARAENLRPDLLWVLAPPNSLAKHAALYKRRRPEMKLVLDCMDLWPEAVPVPAFSSTPPEWYWRRLRDYCLNLADTVVTEDSRYWEVLQKHCDKERLCMLYLSREFRFRQLRRRPPSDRIALCHLGRIDQNVDIQAIGCLIRELDDPVELHIIGDGEQKPLLRRTAEEAGAKLVFYGELYSPAQKRRIYDACHFGLNFLKNKSASWLTNKSSEYLASSLPVLNNVSGDIWEFIESYPVGLNFGGTGKITAAKLLALQGRREQVQSIYDVYLAEKVFASNLRSILQR